MLLKYVYNMLLQQNCMIKVHQYKSILHSEISIITIYLAIVDLSSLFFTSRIFTLIIRSSFDNFESGNDRFSLSDE